MNHSEAEQKMIAERYLIGELTPDERDAFEEHMFSCSECAADVCAADAFVEEAKVQLVDVPSLQSTPVPVLTKPSRFRWLDLFKPAFAAPAFAVLLGTIAYQNLAVIPGLRFQAAEPRLIPAFTSLHVGSRGSASTSVTADRKQGAILLIQLPQSGLYKSYSLDFYDATGKLLWSKDASAPAPESDGTLSLAISPIGLKSSSYTLAVSGVSMIGERSEIDRRALDIHFEP